jgi:serine/threonine-protein kinase
VNSDGERLRAAEGSKPKACSSCGTRYPADALFCSLDGAPLTMSPGAIAAAAATDPYLGREILDHIEIRQLVGIGAMGRVYRAFQKGIDRDVAVKILHRELSANQMLVARFHREAKVASRLAHPNVVHVLLVGQLPDGAMYIVMEYLDGMSLQSAMAAVGGAIPLPRALHLALQLCDAAGEAHAQGVVHRDLKPENVMLIRRADDPDFVKVLDFGIARLNWDEPSNATAAGLIFGTARYISPEGAQGDRVGPRGDVYSIATMVYQMLSGRTPFDADQTVALLVQQIHDDPPSIKSIERAAYVPDPVAVAIMANLSKRPDDRAADGHALGRALLEAAIQSGLSAQDILARPALLGVSRGAHASVVQMPSVQRTKQLTLEPDVAMRLAMPAPDLEAGRAWQTTAFETPSAESLVGTRGPMSHGPGRGERASPHQPSEASSHPPSEDGARPHSLVPGEYGRISVQTEVSDPAALPPAAQTAKWTPRADLQAKLNLSPTHNVDATMDEQQALRAPAPRTAYLSKPSPTFSTPTPPPFSTTDLPRTPPPQSRPPSSVDATLAGERPSRFVTRAAWVALVIGCFGIGVIGMAGLVWRAGLLSRTPARSGLAPSATPLVLEPLSPPATESPAVPASTDLLHPPSPPATSLGEPPLPPLLTPRGVGPPVGTASGTNRFALDASNGRPGIGQPVDFVARAVGSGTKAKIDNGFFRIAGPGLTRGTEIAAPDDGTGAFRTTFTFLQAGRFEVRFSARADGAAVAVSRTVVVGDSLAAPPPVEPAMPAPPDNAGKWL